jgi:DNA invertase Pin-like site-specific DNA recombinase
MSRTEASRKRCAIYTRKSSEEGLEQEFNSLKAQHEACEAYIRSQRHESWVLARTRYDDGGFSGGNLERPGCKHCSPTSAPGGSTSSWSTKSTG